MPLSHQHTSLPPGDEHDPSAALSIHDLTVAYDRRPVLWDVDLDVPTGCLAAIVGPNGAGKSTLIKACLDLIPRVSGEVRMFGSPWRAVRQRVAYVPQRETVDWDFPVSVLDVVAMGTYGRLGWLRPVGKAQKACGDGGARTRGIDRTGASANQSTLRRSAATCFSWRGPWCRTQTCT